VEEIKSPLGLLHKSCGVVAPVVFNSTIELENKLVSGPSIIFSSISEIVVVCTLFCTGGASRAEGKCLIDLVELD